MGKKVKCWEFFHCKAKECPVYQSKELNCWLFSGTHCRSGFRGKFLEKMEMCLECNVFMANMNVDSMKDTVRVVHEQIKEYRRKVEDRDRELQDIRMDFALGLSESFEMLQKLFLGDPKARIEITTKNELLAKLQSELNRTAEEADRRASQAALIYKVGQRVSKELNLEALLSEIGTTVQEAFNYYCVMLLLIDEKTNRLNLRSIAGGHTDFSIKDLWIPVGEGLLGQAAATGNTQVISDAREDTHYKQKEVTKSELAVPIKRVKKVIGVLYIQSDEYDAFDEMDVTAMENISAQIATAIENAQLYEQAQREIADRVRAEKALTLEKAYLEQLFENAPEAIVMVDNEGGILRVNSEFNELFGYTRDEVFGRCVDEMIAPEDLHDEAESITKRVAKGEKSTFETVRQRKDGTLIHVSIIGSPIIVGDEQVAAYGIYRDITKRVREEEKRAQLLKELEIANRELKDFAYIVSHDLKAPLRAIGSLSNWILNDYEKKLDEEGKELLYLLVGRVIRMNDLIDSILQYSRVGRIRKEKQDVNMDQLVTEVIDMIDPPQNIKIEVEKELPLISFEKTRMEQIFQNLVGNAVKYMDKPEGEIKINCAPEKDCWKFSVSDNGPGIEDKYFDKIFQIFQTLVPRDECESTGIGLTLVKRIVETYGGKIWVESKVGAGSTFFFTIPQ